MTTFAPSKIHTKTVRETKGSRLDFLLFLGFLYYLLTLTFEGPLRYALVLAHSQTFLYARDGIAVFSVLTFLFRGITNSRPISEPCAVATYLLLVHAFIAIWIGNGIFPILFSIKLFLSALYGLAISDQVYAYQQFIPKFFALIFAGTVTGIIFNYFYGTLPWEGELFESAFGTVKTTRVWWAAGERRLSGFARASYSAALIIGLTGAFMLGHYKSVAVKAAIIIFGSAAIYLSTSKGMIIAFALAGAWSVFNNGAPKENQGNKIIPALIICCIFIPVIAALSQANPAGIRTVPGFLSSFWDRVAVTWPATFSLLGENFGWLIGKGLGGGGTAVMMGHNYQDYTAIDNYFWYMYSIFGIAGIAYFATPIRQTIMGQNHTYPFNREFICILIVMITYGITTVLFEDAFFGIIFGVMSAWPIARKEKTNAL